MFHLSVKSTIITLVLTHGWTVTYCGLSVSRDHMGLRWSDTVKLTEFLSHEISSVLPYVIVFVFPLNFYSACISVYLKCWNSVKD